MNTPKRAYEDVDPDYTDACEQQAKRQRELEQDAKVTVGRKIQAIVRNEFQTEINNKEFELHQVDRRLNEARLMMDRLRACIISTYYGQINQLSTSETSRINAPAASIHPSVKKHLGKRPSHYETSSCQSNSSVKPETTEASSQTSSLHKRSNSGVEKTNGTSRISLCDLSSCSTPAVGVPALSDTGPSFDDRRARFKIKKKLIIGNVSKYIPVDHREPNDKSSHKWMVYVRGPRSEPDISGFVKKVWFFLHHSYKPNDLVEISSPPFHLTRRGWGEFPVRVQLHFIDPRNKKVDVIHQLKLDKTFSSLQTLGAETTIELDLEKDFFESDVNCSSNHMVTSDCLSSSVLSTSHQKLLPPQSLVETSNDVSFKYELCSQNGITADKNIIDKNIVVDVTNPACENPIGRTEMTEVDQLNCMEENIAKNVESNVKPLEDYNVTIVHDSEESQLCRQKEESIREQVSEKAFGKLESVIEQRSMKSLPSGSNTLTVSMHTAQTPSNKVAALTVINKPQWINPNILCASELNESMAKNLQASQSSEIINVSSLGTNKSIRIMNTANVANRIKESVSVSSLQKTSKLVSNSSQSDNYLLVSSNSCSLKIPSSPAAPVLQSNPAVSSSSSTLSLGGVPRISTGQAVVTTVYGQSPAQKLSSPCVTRFPAYTLNNAKFIAGTSLSQVQQQQQMDNLPSCHQSDTQKVIIIKPNVADVAAPTISSNTLNFENKSLLQVKQSQPKQVSLLTGKVFTPRTQASVVTVLPASSGAESLLGKISEQAAVTDEPRLLLKSVSKPVHMLLKTVNPTSLSVSHSAGQQVTLPNHFQNINGLERQGLVPQVSKLPVITSDILTEKPHLPVVLLGSSVATSKLTQSSQFGLSVVKGSLLHVPGQVQSQIITSQDVNPFPKMSAIGMTKLGKNSVSVPPLFNANLKTTTDADRIRNQYEVLMAWKRNRLLEEKPKKDVKPSRDKIDGEAEVIPKLNLDDFTSMRALLTATVKLHPLVQADINKLTHPYCAESLEQWNTWTSGKQLGSEWHRACFVLKYLRMLLGETEQFRGEQLMTTRCLVRWCRLHAFSPVMPVLKAGIDNIDNSAQKDLSSFKNTGHIPSYTSADSLYLQKPDETETDVSVQDLDIVDIEDSEKRKAKSSVRTFPDPDNSNQTLELLPSTGGAQFVYDELRKRGIKLQPNELDSNVMSYTAADMLYTAMQEFLTDILRETVAVSTWQSAQSSSPEITRKDVHTAVTSLPEGAFCCNKFLGKADEVNDDGGR